MAHALHDAGLGAQRICNGSLSWATIVRFESQERAASKRKELRGPTTIDNEFITQSLY